MQQPESHFEPTSAAVVDAAPTRLDEIRASVGRYGPIAGLLLVLLLTAVARWQLLDIALERDEGEFAYGGRALRQGELPYVAFYAMKLPGIYVAYALIESIFGTSARAIHFGLLCVNLANISLVYLLGAKVFERVVGLVAAAAFALLTLSPAVFGTQAQAEHFVLLPALVGSTLVFNALWHRRLWLFFPSGLAFGLALLVKQHGAVFAVAAMLYVAFWWPWRWRFEGLRCAQELGGLLLGILIPVVATGLYFVARGAWAPFVFWTVTYASHYAVGETLAAGWGYFRDEFVRQVVWEGELWIAAAVGLGFVVLSRKYRGVRYFVLLWLTAGCLAVLPGLNFFGHYFLLLYPTVALCAGVGIVAAARGFATFGQFARAKGLVLALGVLLWPATELYRFYSAYPLEALPRKLYGGNAFAELADVGRYLAEHSQPGDRLAVLGSEPQLFIYADRDSVSGHIYMYPLLEAQPFAEQMQQQLIDDIENGRPRWIVVTTNPYSWLRQEGSPVKIIDWIDPYLAAHYHSVARMEVYADRPSEFIEDAERLRNDPQGVHWIGVYRRNAGDE